MRLIHSRQLLVLINRRRQTPTRIDRAAVHPRRIVLHHDVTLASDADPAELDQLLEHDRVNGLLQRLTGIAHQGRDVMGYNGANEILAVPRGRHGTGLIVGIGARADDRHIANTPEALVRHATGRGPCRNIAVLIERYSAHRAKAELGRREAVPGRLFGLGMLELLTPKLG